MFLVSTRTLYWFSVSTTCATSRPGRLSMSGRASASLTAFEFPAHGVPDEVSSVLSRDKHGRYSLEGAFGEPGLHVLCPLLLTCHPELNNSYEKFRQS